MVSDLSNDTISQRYVASAHPLDETMNAIATDYAVAVEAHNDTSWE